MHQRHLRHNINLNKACRKQCTRRAKKNSMPALYIGFVMTASTVLVYLILAVSSAASQETINVIVLQSDGDQCPPADQLDAVRSNVTEMTRTYIKTNLLPAGSFQNPATSCVNLYTSKQSQHRQCYSAVLR